MDLGEKSRKVLSWDGLINTVNGVKILDQWGKKIVTEAQKRRLLQLKKEAAISVGAAP